MHFHRTNHSRTIVLLLSLMPCCTQVSCVYGEAGERTYTLVQMDGVFACDHIGDGGAGGGGLFGRGFGFRGHICCYGKNIGLEAWIYKKTWKERDWHTSVSEDLDGGGLGKDFS